MKINTPEQDKIMKGMARALELTNGLLAMVMVYLGITWIVQGIEYIVQLFQ
jgi:type IV secretory pathway TrbD component